MQPTHRHIGLLGLGLDGVVLELRIAHAQLLLARCDVGRSGALSGLDLRIRLLLLDACHALLLHQRLLRFCFLALGGRLSLGALLGRHVGDDRGNALLRGGVELAETLARHKGAEVTLRHVKLAFS